MHKIQVVNGRGHGQAAKAKSLKGPSRGQESVGRPVGVGFDAPERQGYRNFVPKRPEEWATRGQTHNVLDGAGVVKILDGPVKKQVKLPVGGRRQPLEQAVAVPARALKGAGQQPSRVDREPSWARRGGHSLKSMTFAPCPLHGLPFPNPGSAFCAVPRWFWP